ncbi:MULTISPECIES: transglycosylase domain-containing protein [Streptomyces]|uniref:transglycosylase domain-containing protein n=1 Tax=Streptomyces TaxID=1883 RepID=UPI001F07F130|nr:MULTISPECIES: transglycosylase domain-containing protein [Streptomyces]MCX4610445.1 penicillin-binding protein [Streptomyces mirabilis]MCX5350665.1 penicillin-binding protein [Streptomyces mirabilis]
MNGADVDTGGRAGGTGVAVIADDHDRGGGPGHGPGRGPGRGPGGGRHGAGGRGRLMAGLRRRLVKRRIRIRRTRGRRLRRALVVLLALLANLVGAAVVAYHLTKIPEPHPETAMQSTVFVDDHGDYLGRRGPVDRQEIPLSQVPRYVQEAVIAAENRSFRSDTGISPRAIARAAWATVSGGDRQGGSTITQQYVKNALLSPEQTLSRKAREALISIKLDRTRSKDEILQGYLNTVYFGRGAAGIQSAARNYFGVDAKDLTVSQGAALASVINIPSYYEKAGSDPKVTAKLVDRWEWVLDAMAHSGAITSAQRAGARFPAFRFYPPGDTDGQRQYLIDAAASEAADRLGITEDQLARGGYTVRTTFDLTAQDATAELAADGTEKKTGEKTAEEKAADAKAGGKKRAEVKTSGDVRVHTAVVALVPGDGAVRVLYGGADYASQPFNDARDGAVEAGTALQPFSGMKLLDPLTDLTRTAAPTPLRLASAYATAAAHGVYATPYTVAKITRAGRTLYEAHPRTRTAMTRADAGMVAKLLYGRLDAAPATRTGAAGLRTLWQTTYDEHLTLTVALFAEHPAKGKKAALPAPLPYTAGSRSLSVSEGVWSKIVGTAEGHDPAAEPNPGLPTGQTKPILATR